MKISNKHKVIQSSHYEKYVFLILQMKEQIQEIDHFLLDCCLNEVYFRLQLPLMAQNAENETAHARR